jgi:hypothetical protein
MQLNAKCKMQSIVIVLKKLKIDFKFGLENETLKFKHPRPKKSQAISKLQ